LLISLSYIGLLLWRLSAPGKKGNTGIHDPLWFCLCFVWGIKVLLAVSTRTRITERGFQLGERLLLWNDIESCQWKTRFGLSLHLALKKVVWCAEVWGSATVYLAVAAEQKAAVERVLAEHLPAART
jgi:hypothetical protein